MKARLKSTLRRFAPALFETLHSVRNRRLFRRRFGPLHRKVRERLYADEPIRVASGPFEGMRYFDEIVWGPITPKWLGSYECELADIIRRLPAEHYDLVMDVGCAEGYYSTGLACLLPETQVRAYDTDFLSRAQARRLAKLNDVAGRVTVGGFCSHAELTGQARPRTLLVSDIEGFEGSLLDPALCPALRKMDILVEVHEARSAGSQMADLLLARFSPTHTIEERHASGRQGWIESASQHPLLRNIRDLLTEATNEHRSHGRLWLWMKAHLSPLSPAAAVAG